jgi:hypothetical protein
MGRKLKEPLMAKRANEQNAGPDKGGMRILYVELNGSNASLQEGLRTLVAAMNKPMQVAAPANRRLVANDHPASASSPDPEADLFNQETASIEDTSVDDIATADQIASAPARRKRGEGISRDRNAGLAIVKSLNLHPEGKQSLKEFVATKNPKTQEEHIAVYIYYLKNVLDEANVGFSHIYTCFKETGERMPGDLAQSCRNASKKGWIDTANTEDLKRTTRGDNFVDKELPRVSPGNDGAK